MIRKIHEFTRDGKRVEVFRLSNASGMELDISTYGGRMIRLTAPDKAGNFSDVIMGYARPEDDLAGERAFYGAIIGRFGNRIGNATFELNGTRYEVTRNEGRNALHGGVHGFDGRLFRAEIEGDGLSLRYFSPDGEEGFPGNLDVCVRYSLTDENEVVIDYLATTDADTVCNLTNHAFFNIGNGDTILDQILEIRASRITPVDGELIPHGDFLEIDGTPYSFRGGVRLGKNMFSSAPMIAACHGFDFNYCIDRKTEDGLEYCACVFDPESGRKMECFTTLPGVQLYTCNNSAGIVGKKVYKNYAALCLETQGFPNAPNCPSYPSTVLKKGEEYRTRTVYKFSVSE